MFQFIQNYTGFFIVGIFLYILFYSVIAHNKRKKEIIKYDNGEITIPLFGLGYSALLSFRINLNIAKLVIKNGKAEYVLGNSVEKIDLFDIELIDVGKFPGGSFIIQLKTKMRGLIKYKIVCWLANKKLLPEILKIFQDNKVKLSEKAQNLCTRNFL